MLLCLKQMCDGKAADASGIVAEMLKAPCLTLHRLILDVFLSSTLPIPSEWTSSPLVVLYKKGDATLPGNYRPIALLSILYKLFSRLLHLRMVPMVVPQLSLDQAAYRKHFSTDDHLLCTTLLVERCAEWNVEVWLGLCDFLKAFDTVEHSALWEALIELSVDEAYIDILKRLYQAQSATAFVGTDSAPFDIGRGVKQGDPLSPSLFLFVMEVIFRD